MITDFLQPESNLSQNPVRMTTRLCDPGAVRSAEEAGSAAPEAAQLI